MTAAHIVLATPALLAPLAAAVAPDPLFARYGRTAEALQQRWGRALDEGDGLLVALSRGSPAGLAWFCRRGGFGVGAYLRLLAVAPPLQGQAIGAALLQAFEAACVAAGRGNGSSGGYFLLCSDFNTHAQAFYGAQGYREVGRLPDFAVPGVVEVIMWKAPDKLAACV